LLAVRLFVKLQPMTFEQTAKQLADCGTEFYQRNWVLGTSGNFSALIRKKPLKVCITASGNHKGTLDKSHFLEINENAKVLKGIGKLSAETLLHLTIYNQCQANSVMHTHSVWGTILCDKYAENGFLEIEGFEMLKGLADVNTHLHTEKLPIIENSQNYTALSHVIENVLRENPDCHGVYLRRHGLYTWGESIAEAKRHIEIFEFLFEVLGRQLCKH
jgi:methylthioribulose-1-phosphate dehydratase